MLFLGVKTHISMGLQRIVHENTLKVTILSVPANQLYYNTNECS
jgi:hypothetical protein